LSSRQRVRLLVLPVATRSALRAHRELGRALTSYLAADRAPGDPASWQPDRRSSTTGRDCCCHRSRLRSCSHAELQVATAAGRSRSASNRLAIRRAQRLCRPGRPRDTPLGHHAWPRSCRDGRIKLAWLAGIDRLIDPRACPFRASRFAYRASSDGSGALGSIAAALLSRLPTTGCSCATKTRAFSSRLLGLGLTLVVEVIVADWCWCSSITGSGIRPGGRCSAHQPPCQRQGSRSVRRILAAAVSAL